MDIRLRSRQIYPAVINLKQYTNGTNTLRFVLDDYMFNDVNLSELDAYAVTSIAGLVDETILTSELIDGKLHVTWQVMNYTSRIAGAVTYQIMFKDSAGAVWYSYEAILVISESIPADDHIAANYPSILRQWQDWMEQLRGDTSDIKNDALEIVRQMLLDYCSGVVKVDFTDTDERWTAGGIGWKITIPLENMNLLSVWRRLVDNAAEVVVAGVTCDGSSVVIESLSKFNGYVLVSTLSDVENLTLKVTEAMEQAAASASASAESAAKSAEDALKAVNDVIAEYSEPFADQLENAIESANRAESAADRAESAVDRVTDIESAVQGVVKEVNGCVPDNKGVVTIPGMTEEEIDLVFGEGGETVEN